MPVSKELVSDAEAVVSQQICHEKGRGKVYTAGLDPEVFADTISRSDRIQTNGATFADLQEKAYNGGPSAADIMDL